MNLAQVEIEKGQAMLDIFKNYVWMTTLLNEFTLRVELVLRRPRSSHGRHRQQEEEEYHADEAAEDEGDEEQTGGSRMKEEECEKSNESNSGTTALPPPQQHRKTEVDQQEERIMKTEARRMKEGEECVTVEVQEAPTTKGEERENIDT